MANEFISYLFACCINSGVFIYIHNVLPCNELLNLLRKCFAVYILMVEMLCFRQCICKHFQFLMESEIIKVNFTSKVIKNLPDFPELITPPVSSHADDDDDDDLMSSSSPVSPLRKIDSSDVQRLFDEPFLFVRPVLLVNSFTGLVCVDIVLHVPFVMGMSSKSSSIFNTGKLPVSFDVDNPKCGCFEYFSNISTAYLRFPLVDDGVVGGNNGKSLGRSTLNDCNGIYVYVNY